MTGLTRLFTIVFFASVSTTAYAFDSLCEGVATKDARITAGYENFGFMAPLKKGKHVGVITRYLVSKKSGKAVFCSHSGSCVPAVALKLLNCRIDLRSPVDEDEYTIDYALILLRDKVDPETLRAYDIEEKLRSYGMCNACAPWAVEKYMKQPNSKCGKLVRRALEGSPDAQKKLSDDNGPC